MFTIKLPTGTEVSFRTPTFPDRRETLKGFSRDDGYLPEDLLAAKCLTHINGRTVADDWEVGDLIERFNGWDLKDEAYYLEVFMNMFSLDEQEKKRAQETAKALLSGKASPSTEPSKPAKVSSGKITE